MSIRIMSKVWDESLQSGGHLLILLALADFANDEGCAYPAIASLAKKTRSTERWVQKAIRELSTQGEISCEIGTGPYGCNLYRFGKNYIARGGGEHSDRGGEHGGAKGVNIVTGGGEHGGQNLQPCSPNPSLEPSIDPSGRRTTQTASVGERLFEVDPLPPCLMEDWKAWKQHLKEKKIRRTESSERAQIKKLLEWGQVRAKAAIEHSIMQGYQGIFEERKGNGNYTKPAPEPIDYSKGF